MPGLLDQSRAEEHTRYGWGAPKIWKRLQTRDPKRDWPARSTIFDILARHDRVRKRRARTRWKHPGAAALRTIRFSSA